MAIDIRRELASIAAEREETRRIAALAERPDPWRWYTFVVSTATIAISIVSLSWSLGSIISTACSH